MSLVFDLAEAINIGFGIAGGDAAVSIRDRVADVGFRRQLAKELRAIDDADLETTSVVRLAKSDGFLRWMESGSDDSLAGFLSDGELRSFGITTPEEARAAAKVVQRALIAAAMRRATWVERVQLAATNDVSRISSAQLDILQLLKDLTTARRRSPALVDHVEYEALLRERNGGLVDGLLDFYAPPADDPSHPDNIWRDLASEREPAILLRAPGGAGKTRLSYEVASRADRDGWHVLHVLDGEPAIGAATLHEEILANARPTLLVLDYLNQLSNLDLRTLQERVIPAARRAGIRLALLGTARPGWLELEPELGPFVVRDMCHTDDYRRDVCASIVRATAPRALASLGADEVLRLCGERPLIALLIARELEQLALAGGIRSHTTIGLAGGDLRLWLRRRLDEDGYLPERAAKIGDLRSASPGLIVAGALFGVMPVDRDIAIDSGTATAGSVGRPEPASFATRTLRQLELTGWASASGADVVSVHDVVVDHVLGDIFATDMRNGDRVFGSATLEGALTRPRALSRIANSVSRLIADGSSISDRNGEALTEYIEAWWQDRAADVSRLLVTSADVDEASYALGTLLNAEPWASLTIRGWSEVAQPWFDAHGDSPAARHALYSALRRVAIGGSNPVVETAFSWLGRNGIQHGATYVLGGLLNVVDHDESQARRMERAALDWLAVHGATFEASHVISRLLERNDLAEYDRVEQLAVAWLTDHRSTTSTQYVLGSLLRRGDLTDPARVTQMAREWLEEHATTANAQYVLASLLRRDDLDDPALVERAALDWLTAHGASKDASHVLTPMLEREDVREPARVERAALGWLAVRGTSSEASHVLARLLDRGTSGESDQVERAALLWLAEHGASIDASHVLSGLLKCPGLNEPALVERAALDWLAEHGRSTDASHVLARALERHDLTAPGRIERMTLTWLDEHSASVQASHLLPSLLGRADLTAVDRVERAALDWLARHSKALPDDSSFVLRTLVSRAVLARHAETERAVVHWLTLHGTSVNAPFVLAPVLERDDLADAQRIVRFAVNWLAFHGSTVNAQFVLGPLLKRRDLVAAADAEQAALVWLNAHGSLATAQFVLGPLLRRADVSAPAAAERAALNWLAVHGTAESAQFVLRPLLRRTDLGVSAAGERAALDWLAVYGTVSDAQFVLAPLVRREDLRVPDEVERAALDWLAANATATEARFVLGSFLKRRDLIEPARAERSALAWLSAHGTTVDAQFILGPLLKRDDLVDPSSAEQGALAWLSAHGTTEEARFVVDPLLKRVDLVQPDRAEAAALAWLSAHPTPFHAQFVLGPLLKRSHLTAPIRAEQASFAWLAKHGAAFHARFVLAALLSRPDLTDSSRAEQIAHHWLADHGAKPAARSVERALHRS